MSTTTSIDTPLPGHKQHPRITDEVLAARLPGFTSRSASLADVRLHYVEGGQGHPLFLLVGWPQTWWAYRKVMPALAKHYHVIAIDMRGQGSSQKTAAGYDKKTLAGDIANLADHLGFTEVFVAGHDVGAMVAFSFAANRPERAAKLAMLDVPHPFEGFWEIPLIPKGSGHGINLWWLAFNAVPDLPAKLLEGRQKILLDWIYDYQMNDRTAISEFDREVYAAAYEAPGAGMAVTGWYQTFNQDIADLAAYPILRMPVLGLGGMNYPILEAFLTGRAENLTMVALDGVGHWLSEEKPAETTDALLSFLG